MLALSWLACLNRPAKAKLMPVTFACAMHVCLILAEAETTSSSSCAEDATNEMILPVLPSAV